ncbi:hypothetical protein MM326_15175 [Alkalihalobacillus sp. LMS6]|uniref:hypothetical protein n=1 Tax=Alkalihalobacillus sp. LMS6 TaxID=2924034 RepID=UPI0020D0C433|nr:hypothetical protein [Alkalihalobacillus sp. LMS6]UTR05438.1 hypothetical protein MM326_15175 [Alkalihalobacillus sp. LMS6]
MKKVLIIAGSAIGAFIIFIGIVIAVNYVPEEDNSELITTETATSPTTTNETSTSTNESEDDPSQDELDQKMRDEAEEIDFVAANNGEYTGDEIIKASGKATVVVNSGVGDDFLLSVEQGDGYGMYDVFILRTDVDLNEGDEVTVYGSIDIESTEGLPRIIGVLFE